MHYKWHFPKIGNGRGRFELSIFNKQAAGDIPGKDKMTNPFSKIRKFLLETQVELKRLSLPTKRELRSSVIVVFVAIVAFGVAQVSFLQSFAQKMERESFVYPIMKSFATTIMNLKVVNETTKSLSDIARDQDIVKTTEALGEGLQKGQEALESLQSLKPSE